MQMPLPDAEAIRHVVTLSKLAEGAIISLVADARLGSSAGLPALDCRSRMVSNLWLATSDGTNAYS